MVHRYSCTAINGALVHKYSRPALNIAIPARPRSSATCALEPGDGGRRGGEVPAQELAEGLRGRLEVAQQVQGLGGPRDRERRAEARGEDLSGRKRRVGGLEPNAFPSMEWPLASLFVATPSAF